MAQPPVSNAAELQNKATYDRIEIQVQHEEDEPINCELVDGNMGVVVINKVAPESLLHGKVHSGDYILSVNDKTASNRTELFTLASRAFPNMKLLLARPKSQQSAPSPVAKAPPSKVEQPQPPPSPAAVPKVAEKPKVATPEETITSDSSISDREELPSVQKSTASVKKDRNNPRIMAVSKGFNVRPDREYLFLRVKTTKTGRTLGLGITRVAKENLVLISSVQPNSISSDIFKPGDRFLMINDKIINDVQVCRKMIVDTKGDFNALIERPPNGLEAYGIEVLRALTLSDNKFTTIFSENYKPISQKSDPDQQLGNPLAGYEAAPLDVQTIINRQLPILTKAFDVGTQRTSRREGKSQADRLKIEHDVHEKHIESDVPQGSILRKLPKRP